MLFYDLGSSMRLFIRINITGIMNFFFYIVIYIYLQLLLFSSLKNLLHPKSLFSIEILDESNYRASFILNFTIVLKYRSK